MVNSPLDLITSLDTIAGKSLQVQRKQQETIIKRFLRRVFGDITMPLKPLSLNHNCALTSSFHCLLLFEY